MSGVSKHEFENLAGVGIVSWMRIEDVKANTNRDVEMDAMDLLIKETMGADFAPTTQQKLVYQALNSQLKKVELSYFQLKHY